MSAFLEHLTPAIKHTNMWDGSFPLLSKLKCSIIWIGRWAGILHCSGLDRSGRKQKSDNCLNCYLLCNELIMLTNPLFLIDTNYFKFFSYSSCCSFLIRKLGRFDFWDIDFPYFPRINKDCLEMQVVLVSSCSLSCILKRCVCDLTVFGLHLTDFRS